MLFDKRFAELTVFCILGCPSSNAPTFKLRPCSMKRVCSVSICGVLEKGHVLELFYKFYFNYCIPY